MYAYSYARNAESYLVFGRAFHHYSKTKDHKKLPELDRLLKEDYRSLNDFRVNRAKTKARNDNK